MGTTRCEAVEVTDASGGGCIGEWTAAGVLPYCVHEGHVVLLLGQELNRVERSRAVS